MVPAPAVGLLRPMPLFGVQPAGFHRLGELGGLPGLGEGQGGPEDLREALCHIFFVEELAPGPVAHEPEGPFAVEAGRQPFEGPGAELRTEGRGGGHRPGEFDPRRGLVDMLPTGAAAPGGAIGELMPRHDDPGADRDGIVRWKGRLGHSEMLIATLRFRDAAVHFRSLVLTVRCFAALALPDTAREALAHATKPFQERGWPVRWVPGEGAHITLKFYGEVSDERVDAIAESLDFAAQGIGMLPIVLTGFGALPRPEKARVFYAGVEAPPALELLQDRIETRAEALDHPGEGTIFHPHVTIGRVREGQRVPQAEAAELFAAPLHTAFTADRVVLFKSVMGPGGARYTPLHQARLGG